MENASLLVWPPSFTVKKHARAKHVKLRTTPARGLELTVPKRFNVKEIPFILEQNRAWIEKQLQQISLAPTAATVAPPTQITLSCIPQIIKVHYQQNIGLLKIISRPHQEWVVSGDIANQQACKMALTKKVRALAKKQLLALLDEVSDEIQLPYSTATVRNQSSRWGSCSSKKSISLNYKLIFLPPELARHIIIHELCHTRFLNHSVKFWNLVASFDPQWREHRLRMRRADQYIPAWVG